MAVHMCQIVVFACPGGKLEGRFEDSVLISSHMCSHGIKKTGLGLASQHL